MVYLLIAFCLAFIFVVLYLVYFNLFKAEDLRNHPANRRNSVDETKIVRGEIFDRFDNLLATNEEDENGKRYRELVHPRSYAHLIGYKSEIYSKSGLESSYDQYLLDIQAKDALSNLKKSMDASGRGNDLYLTIDNDLQIQAYNALEGFKGSIVVIRPSNGQVLAMVSRPSFDANKVDTLWDSLIKDDNSSLIARSINGLYTPGSIMKIVSSVALLESDINESYIDEGKTVIDGYEINNYGGNAYGEIGLKEALKYSSNVYFADKSLEIGWKKFKEVSDRFMFNKNIDFDLNISKSRTSFSSDMSKTDLAASSFGQGKTLVSPLHMAMLVSSIKNEGKMMAPYVVKDARNYKGNLVYTHEDKSISQVTSKKNADILKEYLDNVVGDGIGGKTGTAENSSGKSHSWFVGFLDDNDIAIAVVLEESGLTGSRGALPIARDILNSIRDKEY